MHQNQKQCIVYRPRGNKRSGTSQEVPLNVILLQIKVTHSVLAADAFHDLLEGAFHIGILAVFHPITYQIAQDSAEVIVPGIA